MSTSKKTFLNNCAWYTYLDNDGGDILASCPGRLILGTLEKDKRSQQFFHKDSVNIPQTAFQSFAKAVVKAKLKFESGDEDGFEEQLFSTGYHSCIASYGMYNQVPIFQIR